VSLKSTHRILYCFPGLGGAGKTSLMEALIHKVYQNDDKPPPNVTDGITICDWNLKISPAEDIDKGNGVQHPKKVNSTQKILKKKKLGSANKVILFI
jgi:GTPase SAR1 family protein